MRCISAGSTVEFENVARTDHETPFGYAGIELSDLGERDVERAQGLAHRIDQAAGDSGRNQRTALALEQRIFEQPPQSAERVTDRRLGQVELLRRAGDARLAVDRIENDEEIQVEAVDMRYIDEFLCYSFI